MRSSKVASPQAVPLSKPQQLQQQADHPDGAGAFEDPVFACTFYEPTSVLDRHLSSSPAASDPLLLLDHIPVLPHSSSWDEPPIPSSPTDDWDPVTWFLGGDKADDPALPTPFKPFHQFLDNNHNHALHCSSTALPGPLPFSDPFSPALVDHDCRGGPSLLPAPPPSDASTTFDDAHLIQLIRAAQALESDDPSHAALILARLNQTLSAPAGRPIQRAACYFREALQCLLDASGHHQQQRHRLYHHHHHQPGAAAAAEPLLSPGELVHKITAFKALSDLSPVPQFASFTTNQTVLEAVEGARSIHLLDFDLGLGGHWSSFMHDVAERCRAARSPPPALRLTAVVPAESLETSLSAENLMDFARGLGLAFSIDFVRVGSLGTAALGAIRLAAGDSVAVSFTPASLCLFGDSAESVARFIRFIRRVSPRVAVFVDTESSSRSSSPAYSGLPPSQHQQPFRRAFTAGLEHCSAFLASLDAAAAAVGYGDDQVWRVERWLVRPRVLASVAASLSLGGAALPWREMLETAGMKPVPFSEFTESQAEWLSQRAPVGGFQVARREWSMVLSWQGKDLAATSAWRC